VARKSLCGGTSPSNVATDVFGGSPPHRCVPEWLNSFLAVQGELPAPTMYLTASAVSLDRCRGSASRWPWCGRCSWTGCGGAVVC